MRPFTEAIENIRYSVLDEMETESMTPEECVSFLRAVRDEMNTLYEARRQELREAGGPVSKD